MASGERSGSLSPHLQPGLLFFEEHVITFSQFFPGPCLSWTRSWLSASLRNSRDLITSNVSWHFPILKKKKKRSKPKTQWFPSPVTFLCCLYPDDHRRPIQTLWPPRGLIQFCPPRQQSTLQSTHVSPETWVQQHNHQQICIQCRIHWVHIFERLFVPATVLATGD